MRCILLFLILFLMPSCHRKDGGDDAPPAPETPKEGVLDATGPYPVIKMPNGLQYHTGLLHLPNERELHTLGDAHVRYTDCGTLPDNFDLRTLGLVGDVKDQGSCGSCWAFSMTNSLESAMLGSQNKKLNLSEQEIVSCDRSNYGCGGGNVNSFSYQTDHGQGLAVDYPYTASNGRCKSVPVAAKGVSFQWVGSASRGPTEEELKCALFKNKTVPWITVGATSAWGSPPSSERTAYTNCRSASTNHAVGVVGWWKDSNGKTQFIMKNSWGKEWGDNGYMSLPLGCNNFGEEVAFIEVEKLPGPTPTPTPPGPDPTPTPGPCQPPKVKMAAEVQVLAGTEVMLGVKPEAGVTYTWSVDGAVVGNDAMLYVVPPKDAVYKLSGKNACAIAESQVRVRIVMSKF